MTLTIMNYEYESERNFLKLSAKKKFPPNLSRERLNQSVIATKNKIAKSLN